MNNIFFDMDGTLYKFHDRILDDEGKVQIDKMYANNFFISLEPFANVVNAVKLLKRYDHVDIYILSSVDRDNRDILRQKYDVVARDFPFLDEWHMIFPPVGEDKYKWAIGRVSKDDNNVLIDDYNKNLREWQDAGGKAIKLVNNINNKGLGKYGGEKGMLWRGDFVDYQDSPRDIAKNILTFANIRSYTLSDRIAESKQMNKESNLNNSKKTNAIIMNLEKYGR